MELEGNDHIGEIRPIGWRKRQIQTNQGEEYMTPQERKNFEWIRDNMHSEMPQEDVIKLARQANGEETWPGGVDWNWEELITFAELIAKQALENGIKAEREACAKIADEWAVGWPHPSTVIAERIRTRGQA